MKILHVDDDSDASKGVATKIELNEAKEVKSNKGPFEDVHTSHDSHLDKSEDVKPCYKESVKHTRTKVKMSFNNDKDDTKETSIIDVDEYSNVQETWGKKDPATPKRNPKIGQFQQSPLVPLSKTPDMKKKKKSGHASAFFEFLHKGDKKIEQKKNKICDLAKEAGGIWHNLLMEEKNKFKSKAKKNDAVKQKRAPHFYGSKEDKRKQKNASRSSNKKCE